ncbi:zf-HC2 domain-containing protein [Streptomyces sp. NPDC021224]|uniref:zf-HC2 domain-containing protein n=1 Tax=unclassified Streptomyces TaxID=2593676 RepID=UPI00378AC10F
MSDRTYDDHPRVRPLLEAWALGVCAPEEAALVEEHLGGCDGCGAELRELDAALSALYASEELEPPATLRSEVLGVCLSSRSPQVAVPDYAQPYDNETARLDTLLRNLTGEQWGAPVDLEWRQEEKSAERRTSVSGVLGHLLAVDGMVSASLGLPDPLGDQDKAVGPDLRTEEMWRQLDGDGPGSVDPAAGDDARRTWREHAYELIRTCAFGGGGVADIPVPYGEGVVLPLRLAMLDRAFETWIHATDIADAVQHPYPPPVPEHLRTLISVAVQMLPSVLSARRQAGLAAPPRPVTDPGAPARSVRLEIEGESGGEWYLPVDVPEGPAGADNCVGRVTLPEVVFCRLAAGHIDPEAAAADHTGDSAAVRELLYAVASMSRL